ncbi:hypothetical protein Dsin_025668 [Dipteronia sinensis]|uniref:Retrotransposon Copia-like N-terminal domain-containing protein n=1 Tax=Dipteronia sinensis TaxID=43782 RepID=A0AAE0DXB7_9ROSI|nr:hypothetical protein Dsin_025668 [Dipteronia sinensis]
MAETRSNNSSLTESHNISYSSTKTMDFSSLAKTLSLNLTLKLDHTNYIFWKTQVLTAIEALDLESFINGEKTLPPKFINTLSDSCDISVQQENPDFLNLKKSDKLLMSWNFSTLTQSILGQVTSCKSSCKVWSKIERTYAQRSIARIMQLK